MKGKILAIIGIILIIMGVIIIKNQHSNVEYDIESVDIYNYIKYKDGDNFGIIDRSGKVIIDAKYSKIEIPNPSKDVFLCYEKDNEKATVMNSKKEVILEKYEKIEPVKIKNIASTLCYEKSVLKYQENGLYGLVDFSGKKITKNSYNSIENLLGTEGKFQVESNGKYGVVNLNGDKLVDTKFDKVATDEYYDDETKYSFAGFIVSNKTDNGYRYGYIDYRGKQLLGAEYNDMVRITAQKEVYLIASKDGKYGFYKGNKQLLKSEYQSISYTDNGAIIFEKNGKFGIANLRGEIKVEPKYEQFEENGIYVYMQTTRENDVYDIDGNKVDINFNKAVFNTENENYRITTILNNDITYYGVEDKDGKVLLDSKYKYIEYVCDNNFIVEDENEKYGVINTSNVEKIKLEYDLIQKIKDKNIVQAQKINSNKTEIYSAKMELVVKMKNARVDNKKGFIRIYNGKEEEFLNAEGNKIEKDSDIVKNELQSELPDKIGDYKKYQYSLDDAYYKK